jgi:hypothetical protein
MCRTALPYLIFPGMRDWGTRIHYIVVYKYLTEETMIMFHGDTKETGTVPHRKASSCVINVPCAHRSIHAHYRARGGDMRKPQTPSLVEKLHYDVVSAPAPVPGLPSLSPVASYLEEGSDWNTGR